MYRLRKYANSVLLRRERAARSIIIRSENTQTETIEPVETELRMKDKVSIYTLNFGVHPTHTTPLPKRIIVEMISGGGGGMGSRPIMAFGQGDMPYGMYGGKGGPCCFDTRDPQRCLNQDGTTFVWVDHKLENDHPVFFQGNPGTLWYVYGPTKTADTFQLAQYPYTAPGVTTPYEAHNFGAGLYTIIVFKFAVLGGNGGGIIGDQAIPGAVIGFYIGNQPYAHSMYEYGECGHNVLCGGGAGGGSPVGGAGAVQIGGLVGNWGNDLQGGGGSGAGLELYPPMPGAILQWGPGGGAGGSRGIVSADVKNSYIFYVGDGGTGGAAGLGGFAGGRGGRPLLKITEIFV